MLTLLYPILIAFTFTIKTAVNNVTGTGEINLNEWNPIASSINFPDIGTFERGPTGSHSAFLPNTPDEIRTKFWYASRTVKEITYRAPATLDWVFMNTSIAVIVHGFGSFGNDFLVQKIRNSILKQGKVNGTIVVDWEIGAKLPNYFQAASNTQVVGRQLAVLLDKLRQRRKIDPANYHLICFSLGTHLCGFAGKWAKDKLGFTLGRITPLDAASPLFEGFDSHVSWRDATYVDVIHTSAGSSVLRNEFGFTKPIGHVDFYPSGGVKQPMCEGKDRLCSHLAALIYFEISISYEKQCEFKSVNCPTYAKFNSKQCNLKNTSKMGFLSVKEKGTGKQYLNTTNKHPFCLSKDLFY